MRSRASDNEGVLLLLCEILLRQPQLEIFLQARRNLQKTNPRIPLAVSPCDLAARLDRIARARQLKRDLERALHIEIALEMHPDPALAQVQ
jgi:hypothetical protein